MKTNRIYSIFSRGLPYGNSCYSRFVDQTAYKYENTEGQAMLSALVPYNNDEYLRAVYAEHLTQFLWNSQMRPRAVQLDPYNGYDKANMLFPAPGSEVIKPSVIEPFEVIIVSNPEVLAGRGNGRFEMACVVNAVSNTLTYAGDSFSFTITNGLSSKIGLIPGMDLRIRSDFANTEYVFTIRHTLPERVIWDMIRDRVGKAKPVWTDPSLALIWEEDSRWDQRLAAYMMSTVELFDRA